MKKMIIKYKIRNIVLDVIYYSIVLVSAWLFNKWLEMICYVLAYTLIRSEFIKQVHGSDFAKANAVSWCRNITLLVQMLSIGIIITIDISKYINLVIALLLGFSNFYVKDYFEVFIVNKTTFYKGMEEIDMPEDLVGIEREIMEQYYIKRYKLDKIAFNVNYSVDNVKKLKAKIIKKYS